jgi:hypothetical protein
MTCVLEFYATGSNFSRLLGWNVWVDGEVRGCYATRAEAEAALAALVK